MENKIFSFYLKKLLTGSIAMSLVNAIEKVIAFVLLPVFTYYLSPEDYGVISLIAVTASFLSMIYNPGIISATLRLFYDQETIEKKRELFGSSFMFIIILPLTVIFISFFVGDWVFSNIFNDFSFWPYGFIAIIIAFIVQPNRLWNSLLLVQYKVPKIAFWTLISFVTGVAVSVLLVVFLNYGLGGRVAGNLTGQLTLFVISIITIFNYTKLKGSVKTFYSTFKLGLPLTIGVWAYVLLDISNRYILERLLDISAVGIYDVGHKISTLPVIISIGYKQVWSPLFFENMKLGNYKIISRLSTYFILLFATGCGGFILFSKEIIEILIDPTFHSAAEIVPWVTLGVFVLGILGTFSSVLEYQKKFLTIGIVAGIAALINIACNFLLINFFGIKGAAMASFVAYAIYFAMILYLIRKSIFDIFDIKRLGISILFLISCFFYVIFFNDFHFIWKFAIVGLWAVLVFYTNIIFNSEEKKQFMSFTQKIVKKNKKVTE